MNKICFFREKAGLSQRALSKMVHRTQGAICHYELGTRHPSLAISRKIVKAINDAGVPCTLDDVFPVNEQ